MISGDDAVRELTARMMAGDLLIQIVEAGSVIYDRDTGQTSTVEDGMVILRRRTLFITERTYEKLRSHPNVVGLK